MNVLHEILNELMGCLGLGVKGFVTHRGTDITVGRSLKLGDGGVQINNVTLLLDNFGLQLFELLI